MSLIAHRWTLWAGPISWGMARLRALEAMLVGQAEVEES